jgi:DNA-binding cell septation regulator SpoVG
VDIRIDDKIELFGIRVVKDNDGKLWVAMPSYVLMNQKKKSFVKVIRFPKLEDWIEVRTTILDYYLNNKGDNTDGN